MNTNFHALIRSLPLIALLMLACCTTARAVEAVQIAPPTVVTVRMDTGALIFDIAWSDHRDEAMDQLCGEIIQQLDNQTGYYLIDLPQLQPTWDTKAMRSRDTVIDMQGDIIRRRDLSKGRNKYAQIYEECIAAIAARIRDARPRIHFAFVGLEPAELNRGRNKWTNFSDDVPGFHISEPVFWLGNISWLSNSIRRSIPKQSVWELADSGATFSFRTTNGDWYIASFDEIDVEDIDDLLPGANSSPSMAGSGASGSGAASGGSPSSNDDSPLPTFTSGGSSNADEDDEPQGSSGGSDNPPPMGSEDPGEPAPDPNQLIEFPPRAEEPYGSEHGRVRLGDVDVLAPYYARRDTPFVGIALSHRNRVNPSNPRGWLGRYDDLPNRGFMQCEKLMDDMSALHQLGIREVWFWSWSGQHAQEPGFSEDVMPWYTPEAHTPIMQASWSQFVNHWRSRGMRFGFWLGGVSFPNLGTADDPDHRAIKREHFNQIADDIAALKQNGFDAVGLDAFVWILSQRDMPEWANWNANQHGPRDSGIALALLNRLRTDPRLLGMHFATEAQVPYGTHLQAAPTFQLCTPNGMSNGHRPTLNTLERPEFEDIVNPGHEITMYLMDIGGNNGWTLSEFTMMMNRIRQYGYRPALHIEVLRQIGVIDGRGVVLNNISGVLNP